MREVADFDEYILRKEEECDSLEALLQNEIKEREKAEAEADDEEENTKKIANQIDDYLGLRTAFVMTGDKEKEMTVIKLLESYLTQNEI